jgi:hypothetical protein
MNPFDTSFIHNGVHIMNPTLSEDGRFSVSPSHYGFSIESTGGGSTAWVKYLDNGVLVITDKGGCSHKIEDEFMLGFYDGSEDEGTWGNCLAIIDSEESSV